MESKNLLGIYLTRETATVVYLDSKNKTDNVSDSFSVTAGDTEQPKIQALASLIAQGCTERKLAFSEVAVALDCSLFMQHNIHSDFTDYKQIAATVKFDTEETIATDISEIALTFEISSKDESGSNLTVYTADKKILSEILLSLQQHGFDPITILPDVYCLSKLIFEKIPIEESTEGTLFGMLSKNSGYLISPQDSDGSGKCNSSSVRTFLVGARQNRNDILAREIMMTSALFSGEKNINALKIFDSAGMVDLSTLTEKTGIIARDIEFFGEPEASSEDEENHVNRIDFAIAYGATLALKEKEQTVNFRDDFSPFLGKKIKTQKALKFSMVSIAMLLIAVGLYFHMNFYSVNRDIKKARTKFGKNYAIVMDSKLSDKSTNSALKDLRYELTKVKGETPGVITAGTTISSKLTLVLKAFNDSTKQTGVNIQTIDISEKNIIITVDVPSKNNTIKFIEILKNTGLNVASSTVTTKPDNSGNNIRFVLEPTS